MPCPHFDVEVIQRSKRQSAVASAACQSGERLICLLNVFEAEKQFVNTRQAAYAQCRQQCPL